MGWLFSQIDRAGLIRRLTQNSDHNGVTRKCLKHVTKGNVLWTVWEITPAGNDPLRFIGCDLMKRGSGGEWGYKDFDEASGPGYYTCPLSFFKDVPEPPNDTAREWRQYVIERARVRQGLKVGDWIKLHAGYRPQYVQLTSIKPLRGDGYKLTRKHIERKAPELNELYAKLEAAFPGRAWRYPVRLEKERMAAWAAANPITLDPVALRNMGICNWLIDAWMGMENALAEDKTEAA